MWKNILKVLQKQLDNIETRIDDLIAASDTLTHQVELLKSVDGIGQRIAVAMVVCTDAFTRFDNARQFNCYAGMAPFVYTLK